MKHHLKIRFSELVVNYINMESIASAVINEMSGGQELHKIKMHCGEDLHIPAQFNDVREVADHYLAWMENWE